MSTDELRFRMTLLFDGGNGNLPTRWRLKEQVATDDGLKWRTVAEGPGDTADLVEAMVNNYCLNQTAETAGWVR